jgi:hypothetical protein
MESGGHLRSYVFNSVLNVAAVNSFILYDKANGARIAQSV